MKRIDFEVGKAVVVCSDSASDFGVATSTTLSPQRGVLVSLDELSRQHCTIQTSAGSYRRVGLNRLKLIETAGEDDDHQY
jgi:hypothetical protein